MNLRRGRIRRDIEPLLFSLCVEDGNASHRGIVSLVRHHCCPIGSFVMLNSRGDRTLPPALGATAGCGVAGGGAPAAGLCGMTSLSASSCRACASMLSRDRFVSV